MKQSKQTPPKSTQYLPLCLSPSEPLLLTAEISFSCARGDFSATYERDPRPLISGNLRELRPK